MYKLKYNKTDKKHTLYQMANIRKFINKGWNTKRVFLVLLPQIAINKPLLMINSLMKAPWC